MWEKGGKKRDWKKQKRGCRLTGLLLPAAYGHTKPLFRAILRLQERPEAPWSNDISFLSSVGNEVPDQSITHLHTPKRSSDAGSLRVSPRMGQYTALSHAQ
jgi:hypothetical protein